MDSETWPDILNFGETICEALDCETIQKRALPDFVRMTAASSGGFYLLDERFMPTIVSIFGVSSSLLSDLYDINTFGGNCPFLERAVALRFPVHDGMIFASPAAHHRTPMGALLREYGFDHCLYAPLIVKGRLIGKISVARAVDQPPFTTRDLRVAERLCRFASIALSNAMRHESIWAPTESVDRDTEVETVRIGKNETPSRSSGPAAVEARPGTVLSTRETEVFELLAAGCTNAEIGTELGIALNTVKQHIRHIFEKLGARTRLEAVRIGTNKLTGPDVRPGRGDGPERRSSSPAG